MTDRVAASQPEPVMDVVTVAPEWFSCTIARKTLKRLMARSDSESLRNFGLWLTLLIASGVVGYVSWGTWVALPAFFVYGTLYSSTEARAHECGHGTPFRTRQLNEVFYHLCSFMTLREAYYCRWRHSLHHTHTIVVDSDPEIQVTRPADLVKIVLDFFYLYGGAKELQKISLHALGVMTPGVKAFVPQSDRGKMIWSSRIYLLLIGGTAVVAWSVGSFLPMMYVALPRFYGGWFHQFCGLTQHAGLAEDVTDHRLNTRSVYMNPLFRFLYFNMNYHLEHHLYPMVPYHALPKLHEALKDQLPRTYNGMIDVYREIIPALWRQSRDPNYFVKREPPAPAARVLA
jgi:fatty acid desaturase